MEPAHLAELRIARSVLNRSVLRYTSEAELQAGISQALTAAGVAHRREVELGEAGRVDFLTAGGLAIEVKIGGSANEMARQIVRYAQREEVRALLVVTTKATHQSAPEGMFLTKPGMVLFLLQSTL